MEKQKKKPTWTDVKGALRDLRREELINIISDLYTLRKDNKEFLHTRFHLGDAPLEIYKQKIKDSIFPSGNKGISIKNARQALSDFKKASGDQDGMAELMIYYCICCLISIENFGIWEQFGSATINIWYDTLVYIQTLPPKKHKAYWTTLSNAFAKLPSTGWGVSDTIEDYLWNLAPEEESEEETSEKLEDMW